MLNWFQMNISKKSYTMEMLYAIAGISRQGHHSNSNRLDSKQAVKVLVLPEVRKARASHPRMGSRPLFKMLNIQGMGINQFETLLSTEGLDIKQKRNRHKTTDGSKSRQIMQFIEWQSD